MIYLRTSILFKYLRWCALKILVLLLGGGWCAGAVTKSIILHGGFNYTQICGEQIIEGSMETPHIY